MTRQSTAQRRDTGELEAAFTSELSGAAMASKSALWAQKGLTADEELRKVLNSTAERVIAVAKQHILLSPGANASRLTLQAHLIPGPEVDALALPNGHMAFYSGLLSAIASPDALACVVGHEVAHVVLFHGAELVFTKLFVGAHPTRARRSRLQSLPQAALRLQAMRSTTSSASPSSRGWAWKATSPRTTAPWARAGW